MSSDNCQRQVFLQYLFQYFQLDETCPCNLHITVSENGRCLVINVDNLFHALDNPLYQVLIYIDIQEIYFDRNGPQMSESCQKFKLMMLMLPWCLKCWKWISFEVIG